MPEKRKVLLVSSYPYSLSSRGMDVLTNCFEEELWDVDHFTFPRMSITPSISPPENTRVNCILAKKTSLPYIDRIMFWIPSFAFNIIKKMNNQKAKNIAFNQFDYIVLESGKPLFLMDLIPDEIPIIYRLSDSVQFVLGKNPSYKLLEKRVFEISAKMIFKKEVYKQFLDKHQKDKTTVIENGMSIPEILSDPNPYKSNTKNAVYVGLHQLDFHTVKALVEECPECNFHIIGPCLNQRQVGSLSNHKNFYYYNFLSKEEYMPMLKWASFAIFPFRRTESMKWFGLTSKFLHFMYFNLPIISYPTGVDGEFNNIPVRFADSVKVFVQEVKIVIEENKMLDYKIDFEYYSSTNRKNEYKSFIRKL